MSRVAIITSLALVLFLAPSIRADDKADLQAFLDHEIIGPRQSLIEVKSYLDKCVPRMPKLTTLGDWERVAERIRADVLSVVYRGEAAKWRDAKTKVEYLDTIKGEPKFPTPR